MDEDTLKIAKEALAEAIIAHDDSWNKEELMTCEVSALKVLLNKAKKSVVKATEATPAKGVVNNSEVLESPKNDVFIMPMGADESLRNVTANTFVVERGGRNKISFWKMPDYQKKRIY